MVHDGVCVYVDPCNFYPLKKLRYPGYDLLIRKMICTLCNDQNDDPFSMKCEHFLCRVLYKKILQFIYRIHAHLV